jgi:hypothetical protein
LGVLDVLRVERGEVKEWNQKKQKYRKNQNKFF